MSDAVVTLQPWDNYPRAFSIWENTFPNPSPAVVSDTLSEGSWEVSGGEIWIQWGGWFNASHHHEGGTLFRVNLDDCVPGQTLDIGYNASPGKQDSIVVTCPEPATSTTAAVPPTTAPEAPTTTTPVTAPVPGQGSTTTVLAAPQPTLAPPVPLLTSATTPVYSCPELGRVVYSGDPEYSLNLDSDQDGIGCEEFLVGVASNNGNLPATGSTSANVVVPGASLLLLGCAILAGTKKFLHRGLDAR